MSTVRIVVLAALGLLVLSGAAFSLSEALHRSAQARTLLSDPVRKIVVKGDVGDVAIRAGLTGDVAVERKDSWTVDRPSVSERYADGVLTIETHCGGLTELLRCRSDLMLDAPPEVDVTIAVQEGDIELRGLSGRTDVQTGSGDIRTQRLEPVTVRATSQGGDVRVTVPYGPYRVETTADTGNVKVEGVIRDDLAPQRIAVLSKVGDVTVRAR